MKRSALLTCLIVWIALMGVPASVHATIVSTCIGPETQYLCDFFNKAKHKIDIRCTLLDDSALLKALQQAGKRGVRMRLVVDTLTPSLVHIAAQSQGKSLFSLLPPSEIGHYLATPTTRLGLRSGHTRRFSLTPQGKHFLVVRRGAFRETQRSLRCF